MATPDIFQPAETSDELTSLEEKILRAVELVTQLRQEKDSFEKLAESYASGNEAAQAAISDLKAENQQLTQELESLRGERSQVRTRIEKLLGQLDSLSA